MPSSPRSESHRAGPLSPRVGGIHADEGARLERLSDRLISGYVARCAARAEVPAEACAADREWSLVEDGVYCRAIADGTLAKVRHGSAWVLFLEWNGGYGQRLLTRGSREHVERHALDVAVHGPVGGPEFGDQGSDWRHIGSDDTLRALAPGGEFRLMPLFGGQHLLLFAGNESGLSVLGLGEAAALQRTAGERLAHSPGRTLQLGVGDVRVPLRAIGAASVLGCVEAFDGARLLLGHLEGEQFGLFHVRGDSGECVGLYDLASLIRGDLGQVIEWMRGERGPATGRPCAREGSMRGPSATHEGFGAGLSVAEDELIDRHLTPNASVAGPGATVVPRLLAGIRGLVRQGLADHLLRGCDLLALIKARVGVELYCCSKTLGRALAWIARRTQLVRPVGKRWLIRFGELRVGDSDLRRWIAAVTAANEATAAVSSGSSASEVGQGPIGAGEVRDERPQRPATAEELRAAGAFSRENGASGDPEGERRELVEQWLRARQGPRAGSSQVRLRRVTMASVPDEQSASRWQPRKRTRDPP